MLAPVPARAAAASGGWPTSLSNAKSSPASSPPPLDDATLPSFDDAQYDPILNLGSYDYRFPDPHSKSSPTSSNDVEPDLENQSISIDMADDGWEQRRAAPQYPWDELSDIDSTAAISPTSSDSHDENPFSDSNKQKEKFSEGIEEGDKSVDVDM